MARRARILRYFSYALLAGAVALIPFALHPDVRVRDEFEGRRFALPARIYARPLELHAGLHIAQGDLQDELRERRYREQPAADSGRAAEPGAEPHTAQRPLV